MRRLIGLIIILLLIVMLPSTLMACSDKNREYTTEISEGDVALLTLFTFDGDGEGKMGLMNLGHAFLSIENISDDNINLLNKTITPSETICIGSWSILEHFGIWYNVESNYIVQHDKYNGRVSITIGIDEEDIITLGEYISTHDRWNVINNCTRFAVNFWNCVASDSECISSTLIYTPTYLAGEIKKFENYEINREIVTDEYMGYFDGSQYVSFKMEGDNYASV